MTSRFIGATPIREKGSLFPFKSPFKGTKGKMVAVPILMVAVPI